MKDEQDFDDMTAVEGTDYELVPVGESSNEQAWHVRILTGDFVETVVVYGNIKFDGVDDILRYNFSIVYSPMEGLTSENSSELQLQVTVILQNILEVAHSEGTLATKEVKVGNDRNDSTGTDDSEESTD